MAKRLLSLLLLSLMLLEATGCSLSMLREEDRIVPRDDIEDPPLEDPPLEDIRDPSPEIIESSSIRRLCFSLFFRLFFSLLRSLLYSAST